MSGFARRTASHLVAAASRLLPPSLSDWPRAMARELAEIPDERQALLFAAGCLRAALGLALAARLRSLRDSARFDPFIPAPSAWSLPAMIPIPLRPRLLGLLCAAAAVAAGLAYMSAAGAPSNYLLVNLAALVLGATAWLALGRAARSSLGGAGIATAALAAALLLTGLFGLAADGAARWVRVGPLALQVSLIVLPAMLVLYSRRPDAVGTAGMAIAALALAIQPDRAMAAVLLAGLLGLLAARPGRLPALAAAAAALSFVWTLLAPDTVPPTPHVDRVLYTAFDVHPLAGLAVVAGAASLLVPALAGLARPAGDRAALLAFGGCWAGVVAAAALGDYPTPLVGYGGSAVLGYLLSVALLPNGVRHGEPRAAASPRPSAGGAPESRSELRAAPVA